MTGTDGAPALLFPLGHFLGPIYRGTQPQPDYHRLRLGRQVLKLLTDDEVAVWALAHGVPDALRYEGWTRQGLERHALESGRDDLGGVVSVLLESGILAEVGPDVDAAVAFAEQYRLRSLLTGLGPDPRQRDAYGLGLVGQQPALVDTLVYEVWQWAPQSRSLWRACEVFTTVQRGGAAPTEDETLAELGPFLLRVQVLLSHGAGYLDLAAER
jgi:hypothetical protein